ESWLAAQFNCISSQTFDVSSASNPPALGDQGEKLFLESPADEVFHSSDEELQTANGGAQPSDESEEIFWSSDEGDYVRPPPVKRGRYAARSSQGSEFLNKSVCKEALARLVGVGNSTISKIRRGEMAFTNHSRPELPKRPMFGFTMRGETSALWEHIIMFLWFVYQSCAEFMPNYFRMAGEQSAETAFPEDKEDVDHDCIARLVNGFSQTLQTATFAAVIQDNARHAWDALAVSSCVVCAMVDGHEDLDQAFSQQAALLSRHEFSTPEDVMALLDMSHRPENQAELLRKTAKKFTVETNSLKLDQDIDPASYGACQPEEIPGYQPHGADVMLLVKRLMADTSPVRVICIQMKFMCENTRYKQKFLSGAWPDCPVFTDMCDLSCGRAHEFRSGEIRDVPQVTLALVGYPCKSISQQNCSAKSFKDTTSTTGSGFDALIKFVDRFRPEIVLTENVRSLTQTRKQFDCEVPIQIQNDAFSRRGYHCWHEVVSSVDFGLSQSRTRAWAIYLLHHGHGPLFSISINVFPCVTQSLIRITPNCFMYSNTCHWSRQERYAPLSIVSKFKCSPYPIDFFLLPAGQGDAARGKAKVSKKGSSALKWEAGFEEYCQQLGHVS
ncbi:Modification methylase HaeII (M.HaeII) (Cytosine-specific methyltransferase HaeII), partial [Durusdinium trenchii]